METFEFLVTSTVQATLYEHQALNYEDIVKSNPKSEESLWTSEY
jgi:hypothetical protein